MTRDPYRRAEAPRPEKPRGVVVQRADGPEEHDAEEKRRREERYRAQSLRVHAELEHAQRSGGLMARGLGGAMIALGLGLSALTVSGLGDHGTYSARSVTLASMMMFAGAWYLAVGTGGGVSLKEAAPWVKTGVVVAGLLGALWGATGYIDVLALLAR